MTFTKTFIVHQDRAPPPPDTAETGPAAKNSEAEAAAATSLTATVAALSTAVALSSLCGCATTVQVHLRADKLGLRCSQPIACSMQIVTVHCASPL